MFQRILIPVDLTDRHERVLKLAAEIASKNNAEILLLHVIESIAGLTESEVGDFYQRIEQSAKTHLQGLGQLLDENGVRWQAKVVTGYRAHEIAKQAAEEQIDLIVVSGPRFDHENPSAGWASLSWKIGLLAPCSVMLVR